MKITKLLPLLGLALLVLASCKKKSDDTDNNTPTVDANGNLRVASDADGAVYAIKMHLHEGHNGTSVDEMYTAYAWFGSQTAFKPAGEVKVNGYDLMNFGGINYYGYAGFDQLFPNNTATWTVQGDAAAGVPGFTHTDNTAFASGGQFTLPASININNSFTLNFTPINNVAGVVFSIIGNNGEKHKAVANGASSVTFTSAEMKEVAYTQDQIGFQITSVAYTQQTINGKKIYFVKQNQHARETVTQ
ncbi:hypothetical protein [Flaviaesturariibacter amylovorans]|uniref:Uncharacterized protein n=1 Tax=Flaviaesturariibacter amylovorans TaxID=1084520 RepID=A0ABP8G5D4_9BACT